MVILKHIMIVVLAYFHDNSGHRGVHNTIMEIKEQLDMKMLSYFQAYQLCQMRNSPNSKP